MRSASKGLAERGVLLAKGRAERGALHDYGVKSTEREIEKRTMDKGKDETEL